MGRARAVLLLRRRAGPPCRLSACVYSHCLIRPDVASVDWSDVPASSGSAVSATHAVYFAHGLTGGDADLPFDLSEHSRLERVIAVHDRARHPLPRPTPGLRPAASTHLLHLFTDAALLERGTPMPFTRSVARQIAEWLCADGAAQTRGRLRSGTYINATDLGGRAVCGVMTGGTKDPLGAPV